MGVGGLGKEPEGRSKGISDRKTHPLSQLKCAISNWTHKDHNAHSSAICGETRTITHPSTGIGRRALAAPPCSSPRDPCCFDWPLARLQIFFRSLFLVLKD